MENLLAGFGTMKVQTMRIKESLSLYGIMDPMLGRIHEFWSDHSQQV